MRNCKRTINTWKKAIVFWGIFPTQEFNPCLLCLLNWQAGFLPRSHLGSPMPAVDIFYLEGRGCVSLMDIIVSCGCFNMIFLWQLLPEVGEKNPNSCIQNYCAVWEYLVITLESSGRMIWEQKGRETWRQLSSPSK